MENATQPLIRGRFLLERQPGKGGWTYIVVPRTFKINRKGSWVKMTGTADGQELGSVKLAPLKGERMFLPIKASIRQVIGKEAGDHVELELFGDDPALEQVVLIGFDEFAEILELHDNAYERFLARSPEEQQRMVTWVEGVSQPEERVNRMNAVIDCLLMGSVFRF